jgi:hypothetical protein
VRLLLLNVINVKLNEYFGVYLPGYVKVLRCFGAGGSRNYYIGSNRSFNNMLSELPKRRVKISADRDATPCPEANG